MNASATTFVVLGLLAKRPGSGYDIAALANRSVRHFWPVSRSQLYTELARLEELGWARGTAVRQDRYPNKRVYETTPAGMSALREWLDSAQPQQRRRNQDLAVLKTFLGAYMSPDRLDDQLRVHRDRAEALRAELSTVIAHLDGLDPADSRRFGRASARYCVLQAEATIAWTAEVQALLDAQSGPTDR